MEQCVVKRDLVDICSGDNLLRACHSTVDPWLSQIYCWFYGKRWRRSSKEGCWIFWLYLLQIIYQTSAGAVILTDVVFWCIICPVRGHKHMDYLTILMHSINAIVLLGDAVLNSSNFPWFRIAYFCIWTSLYVVVQWIFHASVIIGWAYPFLDLSSRLAPLWYILVGLLQIPCYIVFGMLIKLCRSSCVELNS